MIRRFWIIFAVVCAAAVVALIIDATFMRSRTVTLMHLSREPSHYFLVADRGHIVAARQRALRSGEAAVDVSRFGCVDYRDPPPTSQHSSPGTTRLIARITIDFASGRSFFVTANDPTGVLPISFAVIGIPAWALALVFAIPPAVVMTRWRRRRRAARLHLCPRCGYDLRATPDRCPECGVATTPSAEAA